MSIPHYYLSIEGKNLFEIDANSTAPRKVSEERFGAQAHKTIALIDRDGVVIKKAPKLTYHLSNKTIQLLPDAVRAIKYLNNRNIPVVFITNQPGIFKELLTIEDFIGTNEFVRKLAGKNVKIDSVFFCPHGAPNEGDKLSGVLVCICRKPLPGMLNAALLLYGVAPKNAYIFGDFESDIAAGVAAGINPVWIATPHDEVEDMGRKIEAKFPQVYRNAQYPNLYKAVRAIFK